MSTDGDFYKESISNESQSLRHKKTRLELFLAKFDGKVTQNGSSPNLYYDFKSGSYLPKLSLESRRTLSQAVLTPIVKPEII